MPPRCVALLGIGQLINWGVLYYAFAVLLQPVQADLDVPAWAVTGAFSLALLVSAAMSPAVGRWTDDGRAARAIAGGGAGAAGLLALWALAPGLATLYLVWAGLGVCMAASLYEPVFAVIARSSGSPEGRLRALAVVTLLGGLASTVFLPLTAALVATVGWRSTALALAALMMVSAALGVYALRALPGVPAAQDAGTIAAAPPPRSRPLRVLSLVFGGSTLASAAFVATLVPALGERGVEPTAAALLGGLFGAMQLPGRALLMSPRVSPSGPVLVRSSLWLQAAGALAVAVLPTTVALAAGIAAFAAGSGLTTLARPHLLQEAVGAASYGAVNGRVARAQQVTRALGPVAASALAAVASHAVVLLVLGGALALLPLLVRRRQSTT
jgi:MFS family permease